MSSAGYIVFCGFWTPVLSQPPIKMATSVSVIPSVFFLLLLAIFVQSTPTSTMADQQLQLSNGINRFSQNFYKATANLNPGKNLVMSPLSAEIALAFLSMGAKGETLEELNEALYLPSQDFTRSAFKPAIEKLNAVQGVTLNVANKVFVKQGESYALSAQFKKDSVDVFQSEAENVDFTKPVDAARTINTWVEGKTNDKIKDLVKPDMLDDLTRLVLVNAIYFKGTWADQFDKAATRNRDFFVTANEKTEVDMMHKTASFKYGEVREWDAKILELPYEKNQVSMVIILPNRVDGLAALEEQLAAENSDIDRHMQKMYPDEIIVALPKFKIETTINLKEMLPNIGINKIFSDFAELSSLLQSNEPLKVSEAVQKAFIEVNEEGAEAAAATALAVSFITSVSYKQQKYFEADHPFYYMLRHTDGTLFVGRFVGRNA